MRTLLLILLLMFSATAPAAPPSKTDAQMAQLEKALARVQAEQQATYQQFQMIQELRRNDLDEGGPMMRQSPYSTSIDNPSLDYEANQRMQRERQQRIEQYASDLNRLYARYMALADERDSILSQMAELAQSAQQPTSNQSQRPQ